MTHADLTPLLKHPAERLVYAAVAAVLTLGVGLLATPWMGKMGWVPPVDAVADTVVLARDTSISVAALCLCALYGVAVLRLGRRMATLSLCGFGLSALFYLGYMVMSVSYARSPQTWDIETDAKLPIYFTDRTLGKRMDAPERQPGDEKLWDKALKPQMIAADATIVYTRVLAVAQAEKLTILADYRPLGQVELSTRSSWFGLPVDLAVRISEEPKATRVDIRCAPRFALGDPGMCAKRIAKLQDQIADKVRVYQNVQSKLEARKLTRRRHPE